MAFADTQKLVVELDLKGNLRSGLKAAQSDLKGFNKATSNTQKSLGKFAGNIGKTVAIGAAAITAGGIAIVNAASDYESAFAGVRKTVDATDEQLADLSKDFRQLSKEIPITAAELARLGEAGGALGVPIDNLEEFVRVTALLGVTTDLTSDDAAQSLGVLSNVLHLTADEYDNFASSLVALGNAGASTESQIIAIAERSGAAGELIGISTEQVLGFSSAVASLGIEAEAGGTSLQKFFIDSSKAILSGGDDLQVFAKVAGKSAKDFQKAFEDDAGGALQEFLAGLGKLSQKDQLAALESLGFNDARITRTLLGLANNTKLVADQQKVANDAFKEGTALTKEAAERFKTFDSQMQITKNVLTDIGITIGTKLLPKLTPLLQRFNDFVNNNGPEIEKFADDLAKAVGDVADEIGKVDWQPFIDGLKFTADVGRAAIGIFQSMPDWMQKLIVAGFAVNKFTGGLVTSLGKDLAGALGNQFLGRGSSPANPLYVTGVGGMGGGKGIPGGGLGLGAAGVAGAGVVIVGVTQAAAADLAGSIVGGVTGNPNAGQLASAVQKGSGGGPVNVFGPFDRLMRALNGDLRSDLQVQEDLERQQLGATRTGHTLEKANATALLASNERAESNARANAEKVKAQLAAGDTRTELALGRVTAAENATRAAVVAKDLSVKVNTAVSIFNKISVQELSKGQKTFKQFYKIAS